MDKNQLPAVVITALAVVGIVILAIMNHTIPDVLSAIALGGVGVVGGQSIPKNVGTK